MRYQWIDSLKGLGMILVIATHSSLSTVFPELSVMLTAGYMGMFFVLSGYTAKKEPLGQAIRKKANRLLIPYFFYGIAITSLFSIIEIASGSININEWIGLLYSRYAIHPLGCSDNTFLLRTAAPLWFLTAMFMAYLCFYIYVGLKGLVSKCLCVVLYIIATISLHQLGILLPWSIDTSFLCALLIIVGYEFSPYAMKIYKKRFSYFVTLLILLGVYVTIVTYNGNANLSVGYYGYLGAFSIFLYFILSVLITVLYSELLKLCSNKGGMNFLAFIGKHSLRLMCIHMPFIVVLQFFFGKFGVIGVFATFICSFVMSLVTSLIIERFCNRFANKYLFLKYL